MSIAILSERKLLGSPILRAGDMAVRLVRVRVILELILTQERPPAAGARRGNFSNLTPPNIVYHPHWCEGTYQFGSEH
jgi:hypothetical protein